LKITIESDFTRLTRRSKWLVLNLGLAAHYPARIFAGTSFDGGRQGADAPDNPHHVTPRIRAKLHIGLAEADDWMTPERVDRLTAALDEAGVDCQAEVYPGTAGCLSPLQPVVIKNRIILFQPPI